MKVSPRSRRSAFSPNHAEHGYILITLILFVALIAIALTALAPEISQQVKRDREEELIHRGVQYSRAIKHYVKQFGRYPTRIEELENTNNLRFLRKRYKDPITGKDFKILRMGDVQMAFGGGLGAMPGSPTTAVAGGALNSAFGNNALGNNGASGGNNSAFGGNAGGFGGNNSAFGANTSAFGGNNGFGNSGVGGNSAFGNNNNAGGNNSAFGAAPAGSSAPAAGSDANPTNPAANPDENASATPGTQTGNGQPGSAQTSTTGQGNQVFGGGPMVGVASTSKDKTIRVFNKKEHYNQWQFIYDPSTDRGGLLTTPNQPGMQSVGVAPQAQGPNGTPGGIQGGTQNSSFGSQSSAFGSPGGQQPSGAQPTQQQQPQLPQSPPDQEP
ncbi:MAG: hypothetical protein WB952_26480 [Terriglobales bacterium]